ncbi:hypothetical protein K402DRAFT_103172 [Aulographum hederae CBS 113979]|uniref:Uncharacterized protein n=1 Tax=Aulographum hederae CBS 113979 TaxID=1176131 RepID=A0A6G1GXJ8_9PEZI|nr:hypothetical protein K402DRAFT_103172 [Aulographum hederae CBS 113979]
MPSCPRRLKMEIRVPRAIETRAQRRTNSTTNVMLPHALPAPSCDLRTVCSGWTMDAEKHSFARIPVSYHIQRHVSLDLPRPQLLLGAPIAALRKAVIPTTAWMKRAAARPPMPHAFSGPDFTGCVGVPRNVQGLNGFISSLDAGAERVEEFLVTFNVGPQRLPACSCQTRRPEVAAAEFSPLASLLYEWVACEHHQSLQVVP